MGIGLLWLLQGIQKHKSIQRAAREMELSYPKALKILNHLETKLGRPLLIRKRGGKDHGGVKLTPFAGKFLIEYARFHQRVKSFADKQFGRFKRSLETIPGEMRSNRIRTPGF